MEPIAALPDAIVRVQGEAPVPLALGSRSSGSVYLPEGDLPKPVVEVSSLVDVIWEGSGSQATFEVKRHGDVNETSRSVFERYRDQPLR